jgi:hypothetical protein
MTMRRGSRLAAVLIVVVWIVAAPSAVSAKDPLLAGGGGGGGVCYEPPPELGAGWVAVGDSCFAPTSIAVHTGDTVRWRLVGQVPHTVTFDDGTDLGTLTPEGVAVEMNHPGTHRYRCLFHPGMTGSIMVTGRAIGSALRTVVDPSDATSSVASTSAGLDEPLPTRVEFSPLAATVILLIGLPLSLALTLRVLGLAGRLPVRLRRPWERRAAEVAARG